jgi:hypothetical protein
MNVIAIEHVGQLAEGKRALAAMLIADEVQRGLGREAAPRQHGR